jgi:peptidyl-tRNA hydrolase, PTH1 family
VLIVVGLGNPGPTYARNRHNVGFQVAAAFREHAGFERFARAGEGEVSRGRRRGRPVVIARPLTYMNASGDLVAPLLRAERAAPEELLVVVDDLYLPLGRLRLRQRGGNGGHNGLKSIIEVLGTDGFGRLRVGVGSPVAGRPHKDWVLEDFTADEESTIATAVAQAVEVIDLVIARGMAVAMNHCNRADEAADEGGNMEVNL